MLSICFTIIDLIYFEIAPHIFSVLSHIVIFKNAKKTHLCKDDYVYWLLLQYCQVYSLMKIMQYVTFVLLCDATNERNRNIA